MAAFCIDSMETVVHADAAEYRSRFEELPAMLFEGVVAPALLEQLVTRAAQAVFSDDEVEHLGTRQVEEPQRVGAGISILLARPALLHWLEEATGLSPIMAVAGRLAQTRANASDALDWHDDMDRDKRQLAVVLNLSEQPFEGGDFEMRDARSPKPFLQHRHASAGSMLVFAVRPGLEHRVTPLIAGGPRRVYAGWFLKEPEHPNYGIAKP